MSISNYSVLIGRFQLLHNTHKAIIDNALTHSDKVIILIGSANRPRTFKNPFTFTERALMLSSVFEHRDQQRIIITQIDDYADNLTWETRVRDLVDGIIINDGKDPDKVTITKTGTKSDESSFYLDYFPEWPFVPFPEEFHSKIHASELRELLFAEDVNISLKKIAKCVPPEILGYLKSFQTTDEYYRLVMELDYIKKYKKSWEAAPYPVTFVTVDCVLVQSGHILLIQRKHEPGKGLWALPGGFLDRNELIEDGMIRELREETRLKVPDAVLRGSIKETHVFDDPNRSFRGRTITHAFFIKLKDGMLPRVKGSDDAEVAKWIPLNEVKCENMFEDHWFMIQHFTGCV